ncbi:MAG: T9SS type A sorting domain-containing protein [Bacteroidota bacterium]
MEIRFMKWADVCLLWGLLLFGSSLQAQFTNRGGDNGGNGDANDAIVMDFEEGGGGDEGACAGDFKIKVKVANLASLPIVGASYSLPRSLPELYVSIDIDGVPLSIKPVYTFKFEGEYRSGIPIFEGIVTRPVWYKNLCARKEGEPSALAYTVRLQTADGSDYPVDDNTDSREIFSCDAFNFPTCSAKRSATNSDNVEYSGSFYINCEKCLLDTGEVVNRNSSSLQEAQETQLQFAPNPFQTQLSVQLASQRVHTLSLRVMDVSGKQVHFAQIAPDAADNHTIDASQWAEGLYFFQVYTGNAMETHKLIKSQ